MADHVLAESIRGILENFVKQRDQANIWLRLAESSFNSNSHQLEKAKEAESLAIREHSEKAASARAFLNNVNNKPLDERAMFQDGVAQLQNAEAHAAEKLKAAQQLVSKLEADQVREAGLLKDRQEQYRQIIQKIGAYEVELQQALR